MKNSREGWRAGETVLLGPSRPQRRPACLRGGGAGRSGCPKNRQLPQGWSATFFA